MKRKAWGLSLLTLPAVALLAIGCTGTGPTAPQPVALASLEGTSWRAEEIDGAGIEDESRLHSLHYSGPEDGRAGGLQSLLRHLPADG